MRKSALVLLVVVAAGLAVAGFADGTKCKKRDDDCPEEGDSCKGDFNFNMSACINGTKCCAMPLYCIKGKCQEDTSGDSCKNDDDCKPAIYGTHILTCIKGKCVVQGSFGDSCTKDDHCAGEMKCVKDKCHGLPKGSKCDANKGNQCGSGGNCKAGVCVEAKSRGSECEEDADCDVYSMCNHGKCIEPWTVKEGQPCNETKACAKGLYCSDTIDGKCKKAVERKFVDCKIDEDCKSYGVNSQCILCDATEGTRYCSFPDDVAPDCVSEMKEANKCYKSNGCNPLASSSLDTCAQLECTAETNAVFACQSMCEDLKKIAGKYCLSSLMLRYCPLLPTWLRIVIAFSILILIIVVVFVIYAIYRCCIRKKQGYVMVDSEPKN